MKSKLLENFICLILVLLPTYLIRFTIFGVPFTLLEVFILALFVLFLIINKFNFSLGRYKFLVISFIVIGLIGAIVSVNNEAALGILKAYIIEPVLFFIVFINVKPKFNKILWSLGISAAFVAIVGLIQYITGYGIPAPWNIRGEEFRITSVYEYPNAVGLYLTPIIALFLGNIMVLKKKIYLSGLLVLLLLAVIFLAKTDGAYLAVMVSFIFLGLTTKWRKFFIAASILGIIILLVVPSFREAVTFQDTSGDVRLALWQGTWNLLKDRPIFGAGLASFPDVYPFYKLEKHVELLLYPHNIFLDFWVELGLLGFLWLLWVLGKFFIQGYYKLSRNRFLAAAAMIAVCVYGLVDVPYFKNDLSVLFWTLLGLMEVEK